MAEQQKESSVLFSLQELMRLEQDRIQQEEEDKRRRAENEVRAREDAERRAREDEQNRLRAEEERRRIDDQRRREEAARLEALRQGEVERARVAAEEQARLEAMRQEQAHALEVARLKQDKHKKNLTIGIAAIAATLVIGASVGGYFWNKSSEEAHATQARLEEEKRQQEVDKRRLEAMLDEQQRRVDELIGKLSAAQNDADRSRIQKELQDAQREKQRIRGQIHQGPGDRPAGNTPRPPCTCAKGDPLCSCL